MFIRVAALAVLFVAVRYAECASCESPKYSASSYSTTDGFFHYTTTYIVEFTLQCANNIRDTQFYAGVNGKTYEVAVSEETNKYQVSWQLEHSESSSQTFNVKIYDEVQYTNYKKAERAGEDVSSVPYLFTITHEHQGITKKWPFSSETVFTVLAAGALYAAVSYRNQLKA